ncbi:HAD hydrolase family protein [Bacillus cihuensis]|uniref:HAD hydrolase family protein n=1 Tax=Bacillus cihuensis TaxID=1208599 RepID=UPI00040E7CFC|nr:HAD hydrolase family protein [Bacillus cihuensis]
MIFASDLDQTLIYSIRSMRLREDRPKPAMRVVEKRGEREISYMTLHAIEILKKVADKMMFLPVTTRTVEQFRYINLFQDEIVPPLAVTSNGGNILVNGKIDEEWQRKIKVKLENEALSGEEMLKHFSELANNNWVNSQHTADELFHYCLIEREMAPLDELMHFKEMIDQQGWKMSLQGRKLYFVPKAVNKWDAVAYIKEKSNREFVAAAGDSLLDLSMLEVADYAISPIHGELSEMGNSVVNKTIHRTDQKGILAAEDILNQVLRIYEERL